MLAAWMETTSKSPKTMRRHVTCAGRGGCSPRGDGSSPGGRSHAARREEGGQLGAGGEGAAGEGADTAESEKVENSCSSVPKIATAATEYLQAPPGPAVGTRAAPWRRGMGAGRCGSGRGGTR